MTVLEARGVLLAAIMKADKLVRLEEVEMGQRLLGKLQNDSENSTPMVWNNAMATSKQLPEALKTLSTEPLGTRQQTIANLWEMAACDAEIHSNERHMIELLARMLDVAVTTQ